MSTFRERERRLAALEAEAERREAERAAAEQADSGPGWLAGCTVCGHTSDPRDWLRETISSGPGRRWCPVCGGCDFGPLGGVNHWGHVPATFICPYCGDEHDAAARLPAPWNRAGACPACHVAPPPLDDARIDAWAEAMEPRATVAGLRHVLTLLETDVLYVRPFDPTCDPRDAQNRQAGHCCWVRGAETGLPYDSPYWRPLDRLQRTLDAEQKRTGAPYCQSSAEARHVLLGVLTHLEVIAKELSND